MKFGQHARRPWSYLGIMLSSSILDIFGISAVTFATRSPLFNGADSREQGGPVRGDTRRVRVLGSLWIEIGRVRIGRFWSAGAFVGFGGYGR